MEDKLLIEARGLGKDYYFHKIFDFLDDLELFYDALSINSCSLVYGVLVTGKVSIDTAMYTSIEGTIESIKFLIYAGRLGDAFALVRKYADGVFVNLYLYTLLARAEDAYLTPEKTLEDIALEADIHSWSCDRWRLFYKLDKVKNHPNYKLNKPFRISWSTDLTKIPKDEIRYALAYNTPNTQVVFGSVFNTIEHPKDLSHWHPECINPWLKLRVGYGDVVYNFGHITIYTSLFKYLQDIGWLYPYDLTVGA